MTESSPEAFEAALQLFAAAHREDPGRVKTPDGVQPAAVVYHDVLARWLAHLEPAASTALRLAARCQHIRRFEIPRSTYPSGRTGYKRWRSVLAMHHAAHASEILERVGYDAATINRVRDLVTKKHLRSDAEAGRLEDAVCLTFLELEFPAFSQRHRPEKVAEIVRKTWAKMTPLGHAAAEQWLQRVQQEAEGGRNYELVLSALRR